MTNYLKIDTRHWRAERNKLVRRIANNSPINYCWRELEDVVDAYQRKKKIPFMGLPNCERAAMTEFLQALK